MGSIRVHLADLDAVPLSLPKRFALAAIAMFPASYSYDPMTGTIEVDCARLASDWSSYTQVKEFDQAVKDLLDLLDRFSKAVNERAKVCGEGRLQELVKKFASNPCATVFDMLQVSVAYNTQDHVLQILWGSAPRISHRLVPFIVKAPEFMEAARVFPALQLDVAKKRNRWVAVEGFERAVEISCPIYAAIIIGAAKTYLGRVSYQGKSDYYFVIPDMPDKDLCTRLENAASFLKQAVKHAGAQSLSEVLWHLLLATSIRSFTGSVTLYKIDSDGRAAFELRVDFDNLKVLSVVLEDIDRGFAIPRLIISVAELLQKEDPDKRKLGNVLEEALHGFARLAFGVGDPFESALHMSRILCDRAVHNLLQTLGDEGNRIAHSIDVLSEASQELLKRYSTGVL
jgi:hypothetical protein